MAEGVIARAVSVGLGRSACGWFLAERERSRAGSLLAGRVSAGVQGSLYASASRRATAT